MSTLIKFGKGTRSCTETAPLWRRADCFYLIPILPAVICVVPRVARSDISPDGRKPRRLIGPLRSVSISNGLAYQPLSHRVPLCRRLLNLERMTGIEPALSCLEDSRATRYSTFALKIPCLSRVSDWAPWLQPGSSTTLSVNERDLNPHTYSLFANQEWSHWRELHSRPAVYKTAALLSELQGHLRRGCLFTALMRTLFVEFALRSRLRHL